MPLFDLSGTRALITGSSRGIGHSLAYGLGRAGASLILNGRDSVQLDKAVAGLRAEGLKVDGALTFDVGDWAAVDEAIGKAESTYGPIDVLINNAGIQRRGPLESFSIEQWHEIFHTNVDGVFFACRAIARHMIARRKGKIINIASVQSELARPGIAPYTATKGAIRNLTRGMCADWARHGLQINAIAPGYFATEMNTALMNDPEFDAWLKKRTPAGRWGQLEELQGIAVFLASRASDYINGQTIFVDGGISAVI